MDGRDLTAPIEYDLNAQSCSLPSLHAAPLCFSGHILLFPIGLRASLIHQHASVAQQKMRTFSLLLWLAEASAHVAAWWREAETLHFQALCVFLSLVCWLTLQWSRQCANAGVFASGSQSLCPNTFLVVGGTAVQGRQAGVSCSELLLTMCDFVLSSHLHSASPGSHLELEWEIVLLAVF